MFTSPGGLASRSQTSATPVLAKQFRAGGRCRAAVAAVGEGKKRCFSSVQPSVTSGADDFMQGGNRYGDFGSCTSLSVVVV